MSRYLVNPPAVKDAQAIGYNHGIVAEGEFYSAGQVAMNAASEIVGDDIRSQTRRVYENVGHLVGAIGKDIQDVTKVTTHIVEPQTNYYDGYKDVYLETFEPPYPAHTVLGVPVLADPDYLVEIEVEVPLSDRDIEAIEPDGEAVVRAE